MTGKRTATAERITEQHKARVRLVLLTLLALIYPPLVGVRSAPVWLLYVGFALLYSLWTLRLVRRFREDPRLGYLLALSDTAVLFPLLVWTSSLFLQVVLILLCAAGGTFSYWAHRQSLKAGLSAPPGARTLSMTSAMHPYTDTPEARLARTLRARLQVYESTGVRFALVLLHIRRYEEMLLYYGEELADRVVRAVSRRGLRVLGPDAQSFALAGGKVAFVCGLEPDRPADLYDVEGLAMAVARRACEHLVDRYRVECVVGWASPPADGLTPEDLIYTAEAGLRSAEAFRRVAGAPAALPKKTRAAAG